MLTKEPLAARMFILTRDKEMSNKEYRKEIFTKPTEAQKIAIAKKEIAATRRNKPLKGWFSK